MEVLDETIGAADRRQNHGDRRRTTALTDFVEQHQHSIVDEWVAFARNLLPWAKDVAETGLRSHAEELITAVVTDMKVPQSSVQQSEKSQGRALGGALARVGRKHASQARAFCDCGRRRTVRHKAR